MTSRRFRLYIREYTVYEFSGAFRPLRTVAQGKTTIGTTLNENKIILKCLTVCGWIWDHHMDSD